MPKGIAKNLEQNRDYWKKTLIRKWKIKL